MPPNQTSDLIMSPTDPHRNCELNHACAPLDRARLVVLAAHGRYGAASDILKIAEQVNIPDVAWIAPQAASRSWWRASFLAPLEQNEPGLTSALDLLSAVTDDLAGQGFGPDRIVLTGFSQGSCLMLEFAARNPRPWRGICAMSGGLMGTSEGDDAPCDALNGHAPKRFDYIGTLKGVAVHMSCHTGDPVIPIARVQESSNVLRAMGAVVNLEICPGKMHGVLPGDPAALRTMLSA